MRNWASLVVPRRGHDLDGRCTASDSWGHWRARRSACSPSPRCSRRCSGSTGIDPPARWAWLVHRRRTDALRDRRHRARRVGDLRQPHLHPHARPRPHHPARATSCSRSGSRVSLDFAAVGRKGISTRCLDCAIAALAARRPRVGVPDHSDVVQRSDAGDGSTAAVVLPAAVDLPGRDHRAHRVQPRDPTGSRLPLPPARAGHHAGRRHHLHAAGDGGDHDARRVDRPAVRHCVRLLRRRRSCTLRCASCRCR